MHPPFSSSQDQAQSLMERGLEASRSGDSSTAIDFFQRSSGEAPQAAQPLFLLGSEYAAVGEFDKAETAFTRAILLAPNESIYRYQLGLLQFSSNRVPTAMLTWSPLLQMGQESPYPHFVSGFAELSCDGFEKAREHFERGVKLNTVIPALNDDIIKVLRGIQELQQVVAPMDQGAAEMPTVSAQDEEASHHILLSNYQQAGKLH